MPKDDLSLDHSEQIAQAAVHSAWFKRMSAGSPELKGMFAPAHF